MAAQSESDPIDLGAFPQDVIPIDPNEIPLDAQTTFPLDGPTEPEPVSITSTNPNSPTITSLPSGTGTAIPISAPIPNTPNQQPQPVVVTSAPSQVVGLSPNSNAAISKAFQDFFIARQDAKDTCGHCILNATVVKFLFESRVGVAQNFADRVKSCPSLDAAKKQVFINATNAVCVRFQQKLVSGQKTLNDAKYTKSLVANYRTLLSVLVDAEIVKYIRSLIAKLAELSSQCRQLNAAYYANDANKFANDLKALQVQFEKLCPNGGSVTTGTTTGQRIPGT